MERVAADRRESLEVEPGASRRRGVVEQVEVQNFELEGSRQAMHGHAVHMRRDAHPAAQRAEGLVDNDHVEAGAADAEAGGVGGVESGDVAVGIRDEAAIDTDEELHVGNGYPLRLGVGQRDGAVGSAQA